MLGFIAAVLFAIAFIINAAGVAVSNAIFSVTSLMLLGLICLSLHLVGVGVRLEVAQVDPAGVPYGAVPRARQDDRRGSSRHRPGTALGGQGRGR